MYIEFSVTDWCGYSEVYDRDSMEFPYAPSPPPRMYLYLCPSTHTTLLNVLMPTCLLQESRLSN